MSLAQFQIAMVKLLRCPAPGRDAGLLVSALTGELTTSEIDSLAKLAASDDFNEYGHDLGRQRWSAAIRKLPRLASLVGEHTLRDIWQKQFEALHLRVESDVSSMAGTYTLAFLDYLLAINIPDAPAWTGDLIKYERTEIELTQFGFQPLPLTSNAAIAHGNFRLLELEFDVTADGIPPAEPTLLVGVRTGAVRRPRIFVIDMPTFAFLQSQIDGEGGEPTDAMRRDLEVMGLI